MNATRKGARARASSPSQAFRTAADYLDRHGWIRDGFYDETLSTLTPPADLLGALAYACFGYARMLTATQPLPCLDCEPGAPVYSAAIYYLEDFVGVNTMTDGHGTPVAFSLSEWNDLPYQSVGCVTAVLRAAADDYEHSRRAA